MWSLRRSLASRSVPMFPGPMIAASALPEVGVLIWDPCGSVRRSGAEEASSSVGYSCVPVRHLVDRRHVHLGDAVAVADGCGPPALLDAHHDLLGVDGLARVVAVRPRGEGPD